MSLQIKDQQVDHTFHIAKFEIDVDLMRVVPSLSYDITIHFPARFEYFTSNFLSIGEIYTH